MRGKRTVARLCVIAAAAGLLAAGVYAGLRLWVRYVPPAIQADPASNREREAFRQAADLIGQPARIVWSSNRGGNHDLYTLDLPEGRLQKVTDAPSVDFYSRISPDGSDLVFLRSRREWVSFRNREEWDALVMEGGSGKARTIAEGVYHPNWWPDGRSVVFTRGRKLVRFHLSSQQEETIVDGNAPPYHTWFGMPHVSPAGDRIAVTLRGRRDGIGVLGTGKRDLRWIGGPESCQVTWDAGGTGLIWVSRGGRGKNRFLHLEAGASEPSVLLDLPGEYSHEYFPRVSNDGNFLIFAAAAEGHEHDRADYEIFLWRIGSPAETAVRITYHGGNDQWPDIWIESARR